MIIGIAGLKRAGKDTAADYLSVRYSLYKCAFADPVKRTAMQMFNLTEEQAWGLNGYDREQVTEPWGISVREILQKVGTECARNVFREDFWLVRLGDFLDKTNYGRRFVVSDVRFDNEAHWIHERGGYVIKIIRPNAVQEETDTHTSEGRVTVYDWSVPNNGTILQLKEKLDNVVQGL